MLKKQAEFKNLGHTISVAVLCVILELFKVVVGEILNVIGKRRNGIISSPLVLLSNLATQQKKYPHAKENH